MHQENQKRLVAKSALKYVEENSVIGVGSGSTVNFFIDALKESQIRIDSVVAASEASEKRLKQAGFHIADNNSVNNINCYFDGADEATDWGHLIKGGGAALTGEKIVLANSKRFICLIDESKRATHLGMFPLPIEVIPKARSYVARELVKLGGDPVYRENTITDNGNIILDVYHLTLTEPLPIERAINQIPGVVCNGLFCERGADTILVASGDEHEVLTIDCKSVLQK